METMYEVEVVYKPRFEYAKMKKITTSDVAADYFRKVWADDMEYCERMYILFLNRSMRLIGYKLLSVGGTCSTVVDIKILLQSVLKVNASSFIMAHNHPSGNLEPSKNDLALTANITAACKIMDLSFADHLILSHESYKSFENSGLM